MLLSVFLQPTQNVIPLSFPVNLLASDCQRLSILIKELIKFYPFLTQFFIVNILVNLVFLWHQKRLKIKITPVSIVKPFLHQKLLTDWYMNDPIRKSVWLIINLLIQFRLRFYRLISVKYTGHSLNSKGKERICRCSPWRMFSPCWKSVNQPHNAPAVNPIPVRILKSPDKSFVRDVMVNVATINSRAKRKTLFHG